MQQNFILWCTQPPVSVVPLVSDVSRPLHFVPMYHRFGPKSDGTGVIVNKILPSFEVVENLLERDDIVVSDKQHAS